MIVQLIETIAGTALMLIILCVITSGLNEMIATARGTRGTFLKFGLRKLLPDQPIFRRVMQHPLISGLYRERTALGRPPSYLSALNFANALVEVVRVRAKLAGWTPKGDNRVEDLKRAAEKLQLDHPVIAQSLIPILDRAGGDHDKAMSGIETWYSSAMDRVSSWYLNFTRRRLFAIALVIAAVFNIDGIHVARSFWRHAEAEAVQAAGGKPAGSTFEWPIGYPCLKRDQRPLSQMPGACAAQAVKELGSDEGRLRALVGLLGWIVTAIAVALAAPRLYRLLTPRPRY